MLLAAGVFERSPGQERLFLYLCRKLFEGESAGLKEYTVATEALGKGASFDPKDDSIVRVEMHRLRKRLREFYAGKGSADPVKIILPDKSYELEFVFEDSLLPAAAPPVAHRRHPGAWTLWAATLCTLGALGLVVSSYLNRTKDVLPVVAAESSPASVAPPNQSPWRGVAAEAGKEIRILCGRSEVRYTDVLGHAWEGDRYVTGGRARLVEDIAALVGYDPNVLAGVREGVFRYSIPLEAGVYELTLVFAEPIQPLAVPNPPQEETREFGVWINGQQVLRSFDVRDAVGGYNTALFRVFRDVEPVSGRLELEFGRSNQNALVNAIIVRPGTKGKLRPVRIVARSQPYVDAEGNLWEPDQYFRGGRTIARPIPPAVTNSRLYQGERHGRFTYTIPVTPGRYRATLHFWESWWGEGRQGGGGVGSRVFDVYCNFRPLLKDFDILASSPTPNVVQKTFHGLTPDEHGRLVFSFVPQVNRAVVNAIEVVDEE